MLLAMHRTRWLLLLPPGAVPCLVTQGAAVAPAAQRRAGSLVVTGACMDAAQVLQGVSWVLSETIQFCFWKYL